MAHVLVAGSANLDFVVRASHIPSPGETVLGRDFATFPGGKGANQAVACARAGQTPTEMLLGLGQDPFAEVLTASLLGAGVRLTIIRQAVSTGTAFICVSDSGENAITVAPGANAGLLPEHLPELRGAAALLMQLETPLASIAAWAAQAQAQGVKVVLNAAPAQALPAELLKHLDVLIVNEVELDQIAPGFATVQSAAESLPVPLVVVTLGADGVAALENGVWTLQPAFPVEVIDTTAAGDTFCGVLTAALARGVSLADALREGAAAAALTCTALGAQSSIPQRAAVDALLAAATDLTGSGVDALRSRLQRAAVAHEPHAS